MEVVEELSDLLHTHANRDKVVNVTCYLLKFYGSTRNSKPLLTASTNLAAARACLRLFDDAAALKNIIKYGVGRHEGAFWGTLGVTYNLLTLSYLQVEKTVFLIDTSILTVSADLESRIRTTHKLFWSLSAFVGFVRSIRALHLSAQHLNPKSSTKCAPARFTQATLTSTKLFLDVVHAVSWLPQGWLWGSSLSTQKVSGIATVSAILGLVIHYHGKRLA